MPLEARVTSLWVFSKDLCIVSPSRRLELAAMTGQESCGYYETTKVAERQQVLGAIKELLSTQRKATPGAVVKRLEAKGISVASVRVKAIFRAGRMAEGLGHLEFVESQESF